MAIESKIVLDVQEYEIEGTAFSLPPESLHTAHALGTGCGIGAAKLMSIAKGQDQPIEQMILSDPADSNINTTKDMLQHRNKFPGTAFTFHQRRDEDSFLRPGSVDMVIACECLHWMDIRKAVANIYASLRPGGTFAAVHYTVPSMRIVDNERATEALQRLVVLQRTKPSTVTAFNNRSAEVSNVGFGLKFVPLDKDLWADVTRTWINVPEGQTSLPTWGLRSNSSTPSMIDADMETFRWV